MPARSDEFAPGLHGYIGATQTGKTTKAVADARALAARLRCGLIAVDTACSRALSCLPAAPTLESALHSAFGARAAVRWVPPQDLMEADRIFRAATKPGGIVLLVDECSQYAKSKPLLYLCRTWAHARTSVFLTGQDLRQDMASALRSCGPLVRVFRMAPSPGLEFLMRWYGLDSAKVRTQAVGTYQLVKF